MNVAFRMALSFLALVTLAILFNLLASGIRAARAKRKSDAGPADPDGAIPESGHLESGHLESGHLESGSLDRARGQGSEADRSNRKTWVLENLVIVPAGTVAITLAITFVLQITGFFDRQFYRPSDRDYGQAGELGLRYEDVTIPVENGPRLHGWWLPADGEPRGTVVHLHGSDRNVSYTVGHVHWLTDHGFHVLAIDYRGYGRSEGTPSHAGVRADAAAAIDYVRSRPDVRDDRIVLWGQSMGGQLAIVAAADAEVRGGGVRGVIAEATYARHSLHVADKLASMGPLWLVQWGAWLLSSDDHAAEPALVGLRSARLLLIHGTDDRVVRPYHGERLYAAAPGPKDIWRVDGAGHLQVFRDDGARQKLLDYLAREWGL